MVAFRPGPDGHLQKGRFCDEFKDGLSYLDEISSANAGTKGVCAPRAVLPFGPHLACALQRADGLWWR